MLCYARVPDPKWEFLVVTFCSSHRTTLVCTEASIGYEQIVNTGPRSAVNFILTAIHSGVRDQCLRFCSRVFPLEVLPQFYFKRWIWVPLMDS